MSASAHHAGSFFFFFLLDTFVFSQGQIETSHNNMEHLERPYCSLMTVEMPIFG